LVFSGDAKWGTYGKRFHFCLLIFEVKNRSILASFVAENLDIKMANFQTPFGSRGPGTSGNTVNRCPHNKFWHGCGYSCADLRRPALARGDSSNKEGLLLDFFDNHLKNKN
jgi:hypothetical protein